MMTLTPAQKKLLHDFAIDAGLEGHGGPVTVRKLVETKKSDPEMYIHLQVTSAVLGRCVFADRLYIEAAELQRAYLRAMRMYGRDSEEAQKVVNSGRKNEKFMAHKETMELLVEALAEC